MKKFRKLGVVLLLLALVLSGCSQKKASVQGGYDNEILTTTAVAQDKTIVTVRVESGVIQTEDFEKSIEEKFPNVDIVLEHDGSTNSEYTIRADLISGTECDLILSRRLNTIDDIAKDYLLDLSKESFVDNYYLSAVDSCTDSEGKVYYLPGSSDFYGIVYDKTMFEEYGWQVPHSYSEFVELCQTIRDAGLTELVTDEDGETKEVSVVPFQPTLMYPDMFQVIFNTYGYQDVLSGTENFRWLSAYEEGEGSMVGHMEPAVEKFRQLFEDGILTDSVWDMQPRERSNMLYVEHTSVMTIESQNATNYAETFVQNAGEGAQLHEYAMMPFWTSDEKDSDYVYTVPSYFMAINKSSAEESDEKKQLLLDIYGYISSVEGQEAILSDGVQISNIKGVSMEENTFDEGILDTINEGRIINTFYYAKGENSKQVEKQMRSTAADMLSGAMSVEDWLLAADKARDDFLAGSNDEGTVYGEVSTTLTRLESAYTLADMYRTLTGAQIGICYGGVYRNGTNGRFYEGDITDNSLACVTPNKEPQAELTDPMEEKIVVSSMTGAQVLQVLNSLGSADSSFGEYPYYVASGVTVRFNPWAEAGERVLSCKIDGEEIDPDATYEVAYYNGSLPDGLVSSESALDQTWQESFLSWLSQNNGVVDKPDMTIELVYDAE